MGHGMLPHYESLLTEVPARRVSVIDAMSEKDVNLRFQVSQHLFRIEWKNNEEERGGETRHLLALTLNHVLSQILSDAEWLNIVDDSDDSIECNQWNIHLSIM